MRVVVVGAGVTGLAAARELRTHFPQVEVLVLEAGSRAGGLVHTQRSEHGLLIEHGADSLFAFKRHAIETVHELGMSGELVSGTGGPRTAYVARGQSLVALPAGMLGLTPRSTWALMFSRLLSTADKLRLLREPFVPARGDGADESLRDFTSRRFGSAFLDHIIEPLVSGIHGAPADYLSAAAVVPNLVALERAHGSIARATMRARGREVVGPSVVSLRHGMGSLTSRLADPLHTQLRCNVPVQRITRAKAGALQLELGRHGSLRADAVVLAVDAGTASRLCEPVHATSSDELSRIQHAGYASLHLAFRAQDIGALPKGTGFVVPASESRRLKACTWVNQKWPERAPADLTLLRCFLRAPYGSSSELTNDARSDLRDLLGIEARPVFEHALVRERALPCYTLGHLERVDRIEHALAEEPRLAVAGNFLRGIGLSDCIASGQGAARAVAMAVRSRLREEREADA